MGRPPPGSSSSLRAVPHGPCQTAAVARFQLLAMFYLDPLGPARSAGRWGRVVNLPPPSGVWELFHPPFGRPSTP